MNVPDKLWRQIVAELSKSKTLVQYDNGWGPDPFVCQSCSGWAAFDKAGYAVTQDFERAKHRPNCALLSLFAGIEKLKGSSRTPMKRKRAKR